MRDEENLVVGILEERLDHFHEFLSKLEEYPPTVIAFAMRIELVALLREIETCGACTRAEMVVFLKDLEGETLSERNVVQRGDLRVYLCEAGSKQFLHLYDFPE